MIHLRPFRAVAVGLALAVGLAACAPSRPSVSVTDRLSAPYVEAQHEFHFSRGAARLSGAERQRLNSFLQAMALRSEDVVIVTIPTSGAPRTDTARVQDVTAALALAPSRIRLAIQENLGGHPRQRHQAGLIRVARAEGIKVDCRPGVGDLGCANARNLAEMIHRPADVLWPVPTARGAGR